MQNLANLKFTVKSYTYLGKYLASIFNKALVFLPISLASNYVPILIKKMKNIAVNSRRTAHSFTIPNIGLVPG